MTMAMTRAPPLVTMAINVSFWCRGRSLSPWVTIPIAISVLYDARRRTYTLKAHLYTILTRTESRRMLLTVKTRWLYLLLIGLVVCPARITAGASPGREKRTAAQHRSEKEKTQHPFNS